MKRMISIIALLLAPVMLLTACAMPGVAPKAKNSNPTTPEEGNAPGAEFEDENNATKGAARVWPWEDSNITLPAFTGTVVAPGTVTSLKIYALGDASTRDSLWFLPEIAKEAGITDIHIAVLCCNHSKTTLDTHWTQWNGNRDAYTQYENKGDGWVTVSTNAAPKEVAKSAKWDYAILNQGIGASGQSGSFAATNFGNVVQGVSGLLTTKAANPNYNRNVKILWLQTWAYEINSRNNLYNSFSTYDKDQQKMYAAINDAIQTKVLANNKIKGVIPVGTAVQNMREAYWSDGLTRDAEYLSNTGKVLAAVTVFKYITGYDINDMALSSSVFDHARPHMGVIKESANNAYTNPYAVTPSVYDTID